VDTCFWDGGNGIGDGVAARVGAALAQGFSDVLCGSKGSKGINPGCLLNGEMGAASDGGGGGGELEGIGGSDCGWFAHAFVEC